VLQWLHASYALGGVTGAAAAGLIPAAKREHSDIMHEIATARGSLYPLGQPQERSLSFVPLLARYGAILKQEMLAEAREHARRLAGGKQETSRALNEPLSLRGHS